MIGVYLIERMDSLKIIDCMRGKAWLTPTGITPFGNCNNFFFNNQKSIAKRPPPNTLLNYYIVLSEHSHCPENYVRQVLDARKELLDSKEAFNASQMNTNLQNIFATDAAAAEGSELDISGYDKKKKEFESSIEFKDGCYYIDLPWIESKIKSNVHVALKVLDRTMTSLIKINLMKRTMRSSSNRKRMESLRDWRYSLKNLESLFGFLIGRSSQILNRWQLKSDLYLIVHWKRTVTIP